MTYDLRNNLEKATSVVVDAYDYDDDDDSTKQA